MSDMRTTLTLDDDLAARLKELAFEQDKAFKQVVNETLRAGLRAAQEPPRAKRYRVRAVAMGEARRGVDVDKALRLADTLEDATIAAEIESRK